MNKKNWITILVLGCFQLVAQNKDSLHVNFKINFDKFPLVLHKNYITSKKDSMSISTFKCYISNIEIAYADKTVSKEKNSYHLLDINYPNSCHIPITKISDKIISKVSFMIGIDSLSSTSGAMTGDLDPINGMYWAWQSGYINMKIEGKSPSCHSKKNEFQFHIGGYMQPNCAMRKKVITVNGVGDISIAIDVAVLLSEIDLKNTNAVMIPGKVAMDLADISTKMFYLE